MFISNSKINTRELLAVMVVGGVNFLIGYSLTYVTYTKTVVNDGSSSFLESVNGSISVFTATFGVILYAALANKYGRKICLFAIYFTYLIGAVVIMISTQPVPFFISRSLVGVASGGKAATILYTSEVTGKTRRGVYVAFCGVLGLFGILVTYLSQYYLSLFGVGIITAAICIVGCIGSISIPESKYWYIINDKREKAKESALWFDASLSDIDLEKEFNSIKADEGTSEGGIMGFINCLRQPQHFKQFFLATLLYTFRTGCGREPLAVYPANFFTRCNLIYDSQVLTILQGFIDFIVSVFCTYVIGMFKRRTLLTANSVITSTALVMLMTMQFFNDLINKTVPWLPLIFIFCYSGGIIAFMFPLVCITACEVVSTSNAHRNTIFNLTWLINNLIRTVYTAVFPILINNYHIDVTLAIFLANNILLIALIKFWIVETANKPLHECLNDEKASADVPAAPDTNL